MINFKQFLEEGKRGLWDNIHAKQKRIKAGSGERMRKPGSEGAPTAAALKASQNENIQQSKGTPVPAKEFARGVLKDLKKVNVKEELSADEQFDLIEELVEQLSIQHDVHTDLIWEDFESVDDVELFEAAVDAKGYKSSTGGLTQKGRDAYNAKGAHLQAPVTTPPSKLKSGSKAANRRKSFCARMGGMEGPMKDSKGRPTRKALALRKWNC